MIGAIKHLGAIVFNVLQWSGFGLWSFFWMSAATIRGRLPPGDPNIPLSWARRFWGPGVVWLTRCNLVQHPGFVPTPGEPYIYVMNHQSMMDIVAAFVAIPRNFRFIAKKSLKPIPFLGWYMTATGMVFIDRKNRQAALRSLDEACQSIRGGISILVYPEGTRSHDGAILPFKKGPFVMAIQSGVPLVPVAVEGSRRILGRDTARLFPATVNVKIGQPIPTTGLTLADRDALIRRVRDAMIDLHESIGGCGGDREAAISQHEGRGAADAADSRD